MPGCAPRAKWYVRVLEDRDDAEVRQLIRCVDQALRRLRVEAVTHVGGIRAARRIAHVERNRSSVSRKRRLEADRGLRSVTALTHFLLARPDQLHRLAAGPVGSDP